MCRPPFVIVYIQWLSPCEYASYVLLTNYYVKWYTLIVFWRDISKIYLLYIYIYVS